ncbi:hypothetical protein QBC40DRAFT_251073 [Triangularia verruculosa]|uniref:Uncharacterized protein n=1 Tax=Triangularia verruculosa TaxID=2587418 RepID=A0AAN7AY92_9PEZI|nr:hypothetical protein QBC40DRAFT_251073 [Triangularia verruculosa]
MAEEFSTTAIILVASLCGVVILFALGFALCHDHAWGLRRCLQMRGKRQQRPRAWTRNSKILELSNHSRLSTLHVPFPAQATFNRHHGLRWYGDKRITGVGASSQGAADIENQLPALRPPYFPRRISGSVLQNGQLSTNSSAYAPARPPTLSTRSDSKPSIRTASHVSSLSLIESSSKESFMSEKNTDSNIAAGTSNSRNGRSS